MGGKMGGKVGGKVGGKIGGKNGESVEQGLRGPLCAHARSCMCMRARVRFVRKGSAACTCAMDRGCRAVSPQAFTRRASEGEFACVRACVRVRACACAACLCARARACERSPRCRVRT
eukprot:6191723-Pleurochrysis_carterae.AAC.3